jgi:hypothetical protein
MYFSSITNSLRLIGTILIREGIHSTPKHQVIDGITGSFILDAQIIALIPSTYAV